MRKVFKLVIYVITNHTNNKFKYIIYLIWLDNRMFEYNEINKNMVNEASRQYLPGLEKLEKIQFY